jgi:hypothetical protein
MSGGSYDYFPFKLQDFAQEIRTRAHDQEEPARSLRLQFAAQIELFAVAAHDIEWVDSCDTARGSEIESLRKALGALERDAYLNAIQNSVKRLEVVTALLQIGEEKP